MFFLKFMCRNRKKLCLSRFELTHRTVHGNICCKGRGFLCVEERWGMRNCRDMINKLLKIAFVGGDRRLVHAAAVLAEDGHECALFGFDTYTGNVGSATRCDMLEDALSLADVVVLPLPATCDGITVQAPLSAKCILLDEIFTHVSRDTLIVYGGGCFKMEEHVPCGVTAVNYAARADFQTANAVPTAEAALAIAMRELPVTLAGLPVLVVGYGRIGKVLCRLLNAFGAKVYASARKSEDLVMAGIAGCTPVYTDCISKIAGDCRLIVNTVPKPVVGAQVLAHVKKDALVIDLASKPGGVDFEAAKAAGIKTLWALGLPGKVFPVSAGKILADTVLTVLAERSDGNC